MSFKDKIFKNQSPWGSPPPGGGGRAPGGNGSGSRQDPPNLDDIIKNFQKTINKFFHKSLLFRLIIYHQEQKILKAFYFIFKCGSMVRYAGLEPAAFCLASRRSTN